MAPLGTTGDVLLADFSFYLIGDRQSTTVESTKFEAWQYDKTSWRAVHRVDGLQRLHAAQQRHALEDLGRDGADLLVAGLRRVARGGLR